MAKPGILKAAYKAGRQGKNLGASVPPMRTANKVGKAVRKVNVAMGNEGTKMQKTVAKSQLKKSAKTAGAGGAAGLVVGRRSKRKSG